MDNVGIDVVLHASGGAESASEIGKAAGALQNVGAQHSDLVGKFQHRFQHIGLMLFASDALRASGLGAETRQIIQTLNIAISGLGTIAGVSSGGIMLVVSGLAALAGIAAKVVDHHKDLIESTAKLVAEDEKQIKAIDDESSGIERYIGVVGKVPPVLRDYLAALVSLRAEKELQKRSDLQDQLIALNNARATQQATLDELRQRQALYATTNQASEVNRASVFKVNEEIKKQTSALAETTVEIRKAEAAMYQLGTRSHKSWGDMATDIEKGKKEWADFAKTQHDLQQQMAKAMDEDSKAEIDQLNKRAAVATKVAGTIGTAFGTMIAQGIVEGGRFTDYFKNAFRSMAEAIIADIVRMETEYLIFTAMSGMGGGMGGLGVAGLKSLGFALGGDVMVDRPTLFLAGEAGPERATFTPMSGGGGGASAGGGGGGGTTINVGDVITHVHGVTDPNALADQVGMNIVRKIRGSGQIDFTR